MSVNISAYREPNGITLQEYNDRKRFLIKQTGIERLENGEIKNRVDSSIAICKYIRDCNEFLKKYTQYAEKNGGYERFIKDGKLFLKKGEREYSFNVVEFWDATYPELKTYYVNENIEVVDKHGRVEEDLEFVIPSCQREVMGRMKNESD